MPALPVPVLPRSVFTELMGFLCLRRGCSHRAGRTRPHSAAWAGLGWAGQGCLPVGTHCPPWSGLSGWDPLSVLDRSIWLGWTLCLF